MGEPTAIVPDKEIRAGYNGTGVALAKNVFVALTAAATVKNEVELPAAGGDVFGVTMVAIADTERGDVQIGGRAIVTAGGVIAVGANVQAAVDGHAEAAALGDVVVGKYVGTAAAADGDLIEVELAGIQSYVSP